MSTRVKQKEGRKKKEKRTKRYEHDLHTRKMTVEKRYKWVLQDVKTNKKRGLISQDDINDIGGLYKLQIRNSLVI